MRFLIKPAQPAAAGLSYRPGGHNNELCQALIADQHGFCAYTERRLRADETVAIEHFDRRLKGTAEDDHLNCYAVLQYANQRKRRKEQTHQDAEFFRSRFFQDPEQLHARIEYIPSDYCYSELQADDSEARELLDYLSVNEHPWVSDRRRHVRRLKNIFEAASWSQAERLEYLREHPDELSFITALEAELDLELVPLIQSDE